MNGLIWRCTCGYKNYAHYLTCSICGKPKPEVAMNRATQCFAAQTMLLVGVACLALAGCADQPAPQVITQTKFIATTVSPDLLTCGDAPEPGAFRRQSEVALFVLNLSDWGHGCQDKLTAVGKVLADQTKDQTP